MFAILGTLTGLAAVLNAARFNQIPANGGLGLEMKVIASVVVGGTSVTGGTGSILGTVLGVDPPGDHRPGAHVSRRERVLGACDSGSDHPGRDRGRRDSPSVVAAPRRRSQPARGPDEMSSRHRWFPNGEWVLVLVCVAEIVFFSAVAPNFFTLGNFFEISRFSVELGLLAVALTPVIVAGGIDLSVGSMMGLAAVTFGSAYHAWHLALPIAALCALCVGCVGGALNALLIARLKLPALIVTLGTYSLFRGVAEGITRGAVNYTGFPSSVSVSRPGVSGRRDSDAAARLRSDRVRVHRVAAPDR